MIIHGCMYFLTSHLGIRLEKVESIAIFDRVTKMPNERENYAGIIKRGLKEEWRGYLRTDYEFSMAVCRSLASDIEVFVNEVRGELKEGQLFYRAVKSDIPPGVKTDEIKRNTRHSSESIARYLKEFARVAALHHEGYSLDQIRRITEHSERLVREYLELYERYKEDEDCKQRMGEILSRYSWKKTLSVERAREEGVM